MSMDTTDETIQMKYFTEPSTIPSPNASATNVAASPEALVQTFLPLSSTLDLIDTPLPSGRSDLHAPPHSHAAHTRTTFASRSQG